MRTILIAICLVTITMCGRALAQAPPADDRQTAIKVDVDVVNVLCTVHDKHGALVKDLRKADFEIREEGKPQQIRYFARETDLPLTVALLVDVSGSVRWFVADEKDAAAKFFEKVLRPDDRALLMGFSSTVVLWQDLTPSTSLLRSALERLRPVPFRGFPNAGQPMPSTLLYDAVYRAADAKLKDVAGRKVMVIISDGLDNGSRVHLDLAAKEVQAANTIVYGICFESGFSGCSFLKELSEPTGGRMFQAKKIPLPKIFQTIEEEVRSQYALGYAPTNRAHDGRFRRLQVKVARKGLRVAARKGYYAVKDGDP